MFEFIIRNIFFLGLFIPGTFLISSAVVILGYFPRTGKMIQRLELWWAKLTVFAALIRPKVSMIDLDREQNYLFVANHQSYLDIPLILTVFEKYRPRFLAKESLFKIPVFGPGMRQTGHLPINRENRRKGMQGINHAVQRAGSGDSILVFPEGTRNPVGENLQNFQIGAFLIALKSGLPVVPVIIEGTRDIMPKGSLFVHRAEAYVQVLPPIDTKGYSLRQREQLRDELWDLMQKKYLETVQWKKQISI